MINLACNKILIKKFIKINITNKIRNEIKLKIKMIKLHFENKND